MPQYNERRDEKNKTKTDETILYYIIPNRLFARYFRLLLFVLLLCIYMCTARRYFDGGDGTDERGTTCGRRRGRRLLNDTETRLPPAKKRSERMTLRNSAGTVAAAAAAAAVEFCARPLLYVVERIPRRVVRSPVRLVVCILVFSTPPNHPSKTFIFPRAKQNIPTHSMPKATVI